MMAQFVDYSTTEAGAARVVLYPFLGVFDRSRTCRGHSRPLSSALKKRKGKKKRRSHINYRMNIQKYSSQLFNSYRANASTLGRFSH